MLSKSLIVTLFLFVTFCSGQEVHFGKCKNITTESDFDVQKFLGTWYDIEKFFFAGQMNKRCVEANYSPGQDGNISIVNRDINADDHYENTTGVAYYKDANVKSKLTVQLQGSPKVDYWVVDTDYTTYALVWSCVELIEANADFSWILSRERTLDQGKVDMLKAKLRTFGIATDGYFKTNQDNC